jgi:hypothetical protein
MMNAPCNLLDNKTTSLFRTPAMIIKPSVSIQQHALRIHNTKSILSGDTVVMM